MSSNQAETLLGFLAFDSVMIAIIVICLMVIAAQRIRR